VLCTGGSKKNGDKVEVAPEKEEPAVSAEPAAWASTEAPTVPPPAPEMAGDANGDGIPDEFQMNLPEGWSAALDPASNRVYWINGNTVPPSSTWQDPRTPVEV